MHLLQKILSIFRNKVDAETVKQKFYASHIPDSISNQELEAYADDIQARVRKMVKELKAIYKKHGIDFAGFKSFDNACEYLKQSIYNRGEYAYNNLIKLDSAVTSEQKRHIALIEMAITPDGQRIIDLINQDPHEKQTFIRIFGDPASTANTETKDGMYKNLWNEMHKLSEYVLLHRNIVYH